MAIYDWITKDTKVEAPPTYALVFRSQQAQGMLPKTVTQRDNTHTQHKSFCYESFVCNPNCLLIDMCDSIGGWEHKVRPVNAVSVSIKSFPVAAVNGISYFQNEHNERKNK